MINVNHKQIKKIACWKYKICLDKKNQFIMNEKKNLRL